MQTGNAQGTGDLTTIRQSVVVQIAHADAGGQTPSYISNIDMVIIATTGNASDFGDVDVGVSASGAAGSDCHGGLT